MAMQFHKEIKVSTGEYTNGQGEQKKRYTKIGALFMDSETGNMSAKLDVLPMPNKDGEVWLKFFDKFEEQGQSKSAGFGAQQVQNAPQFQQPVNTQAQPQHVPNPQQPQYNPQPQSMQPPPLPQQFAQQGVQDDIPFNNNP